jgi:hypothetical protein
LILRARAVAAESEHNARAWAVWHVAALMRVGKRFPSLRLLQVKSSRRRQRKAQTEEEMWAAIEAWNKVMGGKDRRPKTDGRDR